MGLMKRVHTELHSGNGHALSRLLPAERAAWSALVHGSAADSLIHTEREAYEKPDNALESMSLTLRFVGSKPTIPGDYLVINTMTMSMKLIAVGTDIDGYGETSRRWFLIPKFTPEDIELVRSL